MSACTETLASPTDDAKASYETLLAHGAALRPRIAVDYTSSLGAGAFGTVYQAAWRASAPPQANENDDCNLSHTAVVDDCNFGNAGIVVKVVPLSRLSAQGKTQLRREVCLHASVPPHEGLVAMLGAYAAGRALHIVLQACAGDCAAALAAGAPLGTSLGPRLMGELFGAVAHLHAHEIVHADLKPSNFLLDHMGRLKLCDLGAAARLAHGSGRSTLVGSPAYLAPEIVAITQLGLLRYLSSGVFLPHENGTKNGQQVPRRKVCLRRERAVCCLRG